VFEWVYIIVIYACCVLAAAYAMMQSVSIAKINIEEETKKDAINFGCTSGDLTDKLLPDEINPNEFEENNNESMAALIKLLTDIGSTISKGANTFLFSMYRILAIFIVIFGALVYVIVDILGSKAGSDTKYIPYATIAFLIGAVTSILCGFIGMRIAVMANYRTTFKAMNMTEADAYSDAFKTAYKAGCVMGFGLVGISLGVLQTLMLVYIYSYGPSSDGVSVRSYENLMDLIAGYGLGGSSMALFGRVGGGIYTKAADVGSDLAGKLENALPEDDPRNPGVVADNVGDNVGDIAGMGSDLFGSFAESTCASLVLICSNKSLFNTENKTVLWYPLMISAVGILASFATVQVAFYG
jgi:inorganic pyrophosphatase